MGKDMGLFYLILIALGLRVAAAVLLPVMSWDDSYTWWILAIETKNNSFIYTDPWKGHDTIFPPLYPVVSALFMALFSSENIWAPRSISIASGTVVVAMAYLIARRIITPGNTKGPDKRVEPFWTNAPFVGALLLAINPFHIGYTSTVGNEPIFSAWLMFALYFLLKTEKTNHYSYIAAFFVFLASLTRFEIWMLFPFIIWVLIKQQRVATKQFVVSSGIVALGPLIWIWRQQKEFGSWHLFLDFYLSGGSAATASATGDSLLNALFVINISGLFTFGISWYVFYYGFRKLISSKSMKTPGNLSPEINLRDFQVIYGFFSAYVLIMVVISALGLFPAWIKYHVGYFPSVFVIFSIAYYEKLLPALSRLRKNLFFEWKILAVLALIIFCFFKLLPKNINVINYLNGTQQSMIIKAGKVFAGQYEGGMIMIDLPSFIYGTGIPVDKFISSNNIPDDPSHWGKYLEENNIRYLVWTSADYARISRFNEDLVKKNESGVKFEHIYSTDPNPVRKCHVYKVVDYGL